MRFTVVVVAVLSFAANEGRAQFGSGLDCAPSQLSLRGFDVIPADGIGGVPTNATPFVTGADLELRLVGPNGDIPATIEDMLVVGSFGAQSTVRRVVPAGDLSPGETITIEADGQIRSTFTVADFRDDAAPDAPGASVDDVAQGQDTACGPIQSSVTVGLQVPIEGAGDAAFFVGVVNGQPAVGAGVRLDGAAAGDQLVLFTEGAVEVNIAAVDLAGNVSASVPLNVDVPKGPGLSCASTSSAPTFGAVLALFTLLARTRQRANANSTSSSRLSANGKKPQA